MRDPRPAIRLLLVHDEQLFVESLRMVIESSAAEIEVVAVAQTMDEAERWMRSAHPDVVVVGPHLHRYQDLRRLSRSSLGAATAKLIQLGPHQNEPLLDLSPQQLIDVIRRECSSVCSLWRRNTQNNPEILVDRLDPKHRRIFDLLLESLDNREIAEEMCLAVQTVKNYVSDIYAELGVADRLHLIRWARRNGISPAPDRQSRVN